MQVVLFNGSPRKNGNTAILLRHLSQKLNEAMIQTEMIQVGGQTIKPCTACYQCRKKRTGDAKLMMTR